MTEPNAAHNMSPLVPSEPAIANSIVGDDGFHEIDSSLSDSSLLRFDSDIVDSDATNGAKAVRFGVVQIYEFPIIVGGGPAPTGGPPITIDWVFPGEQPDGDMINIDFYEYCNPSSQRRRKRELVLTPYDRTKLLFDSGVTLDEIADATLESDAVNRQRNETLQLFRKTGDEDESSAGWNLWNKTVGRTMKKLVKTNSKRNTLQARTA